ncbi:hypothetical protein RvY_01942 [Ramazzottius varieornatus]|uniref:DDE-1 domain-containing protein n=1 Tax=Ramazzottius varieornatus TaxID=947166 RepID=A0A1D1UQ40_RAMVA|nr:hypothetical protein RvY_01942 [Ramazzottius varieornatus]
MEKFKERHDIDLKTLHREESSTDLVALENWFTVDLPKVQMNVNPRNLLNADETGLFWRNVGVKSLIIGRRQETGVRIAKDRITIFLLCSAAGEKFAICVIGTAERPRAFEKNAVHDVTVDKYGFSYYHNSTAWMTTSIFNSWLDWLNADMVKQDRHVLLVVDNFIAHKVSSRSNVMSHFFPPNCTARAQPLDVGIIKSFTDYFEKHLFQRVFEKLPVINGVEDFVKALTVFGAVDWAMEAWKSVKPSTIVNCFHKCKMVDQKFQDAVEPETVNVASDHSSVMGIVRDLRNQTPRHHRLCDQRLQHRGTHVFKFLLHRDEDHPTGLKEFIREWRKAGEKPPKRFRESLEWSILQAHEWLEWSNKTSSAYCRYCALGFTVGVPMTKKVGEFVKIPVTNFYQAPENAFSQQYLPTLKELTGALQAKNLDYSEMLSSIETTHDYFAVLTNTANKPIGAFANAAATTSRLLSSHEMTPVIPKPTPKKKKPEGRNDPAEHRPLRDVTDVVNWFRTNVFVSHIKNMRRFLQERFDKNSQVLQPLRFLYRPAPVQHCSIPSNTEFL